MFVAIIVISMAMNSTSAAINKEPGCVFYPLIYAGFSVGFACLVSIGIGYMNAVDETEDHYYVENSARIQLILIFVIMVVVTFIFHGWFIPETISSGFASF